MKVSIEAFLLVLTVARAMTTTIKHGNRDHIYTNYEIGQVPKSTQARMLAGTVPAHSVPSTSPHHNPAYRPMFSTRQLEALDGLTDRFANRGKRDLALDPDVLTKDGHGWCVYMSDFSDDDAFQDMNDSSQSIMKCDCVEDISDPALSRISVECVQQEDRCFLSPEDEDPEASSINGAFTFKWRFSVDEVERRIWKCFRYSDSTMTPAGIAGKTVCIDDPWADDGTCILSIDDNTCSSCKYCPDENGDYIANFGGDCKNLAVGGTDLSFYNASQCASVLAEDGDVDEDVRNTIFSYQQDSLVRCPTELEKSCAAQVASFDETNGALLAPIDTAMTDIMSATNFSSFGTDQPWGTEYVVSWLDTLSTTSLPSDFANVCTASSGVVIHASFEIECESYSMPDVPTYYQASIGRSVCIPSSGCEAVAMNSLRESVRTYMNDLVATNNDQLGVCDFTLDWTSPDEANTTEAIFEASSLNGPPQLSTDATCLLIENLVEGFGEPAYVDITDQHLPHSPLSQFSCSCSDAEATLDGAAFGVVATIPATCRHLNPLCVKSMSANGGSAVSARAFAGTDTYNTTMGLVNNEATAENYLAVIAAKQCFAYDGMFGNNTICFDGQYANFEEGATEISSCEVTIGDETCNSCRFCDPNNLAQFNISVDCTNILPDSVIIDQCAPVSEPTDLGGTYLRFLTEDLGQVPQSECDASNDGSDTETSEPTGSPSLAPAEPTAAGPTGAEPTEVPTSSQVENGGTGGSADTDTSPPTALSNSKEECFRNNLATVETCRTLLGNPTVSSTSCNCYNFCDSELLGCSGSSATSQLTGSCTGNVIIGCSFDLLNTDAPTSTPTDSSAGTGDDTNVNRGVDDSAGSTTVPSVLSTALVAVISVIVAQPW